MGKISFAAVSNASNASLTDEEKSENETFIFQEGLWMVLHHFLSTDVRKLIFCLCCLVY